MKNCNCHTEINTDGSGQAQRYLKALDPAYVPVDGRNIRELLVLAKKYAAQIRFYDVPESRDDNAADAKKISWREFFRRDMAVVIASVSVTDLDAFKKEFTEVREKLEADPHPSNELFAGLFNPVLGMLKKIDHWYTVAVPENPLYNDIVLARNSDLLWQAKSMVAYKKSFNIVDPNEPLKISFDGIENKNLWGIDEPVILSRPLYEGNTKYEKIRYAATGVEDIFYSFYNFIKQLLASTDRYLEFAIREYPGHQPHMALFITFLELFRIVQDQMNGLTERMLNFYYREVLRLTEKPAIPDKAYVIFELAKDVNEFHLGKDRKVTAGNDSSGKELLYKMKEDFVVNQARVKELKTIFIEKDEQDKAPEQQVIHSIYARPVANSLDGLGEKFTDPGSKWPTFGTGEPEETDIKNICQAIDMVKKFSARPDQAKIGFAIASNQLLLQGGRRLIDIQFGDAKTNALIAAWLTKISTSIVNPFEIRFTGEKEWFTIDRRIEGKEKDDFQKYLSQGLFNPAADPADNKGFYYIDSQRGTLSVYLPVSESPIVGYDSKLHSEHLYSTTQPVMQVRLNPVIDLTASDYNTLSAARLSLRVKVGSINPDPETVTAGDPDITSLLGDYHFDGLNKLTLQTENGIQAINKPFDPFTPYPAKGKAFYIGSDEVFNKPVEKLAINIRKTRDDETASTNLQPGIPGPLNFQSEYAVSVLQHRHFIRLFDLFDNKPIDDFSQETLTCNVLLYDDGTSKHPVPLVLDRKPILPVSEWTPGIEKGFLKITNLIQPDPNTMEGRQNRAADMEIAELYISYESELRRLEISIDELYHVYPFGIVQIFSDKTSADDSSPRSGKDRVSKIKKDFRTGIELKENNPLVVDAHQLLLPQFTYLGPYEKYNDPGKITKINASVSKPAWRNELDDFMSSASNTDKKTFQLILDASDLETDMGDGDNQYSDLEQEEGMLLIGIENVKPLQNVSLLFQFAEGSAEDEDNTPPQIHWSYLTNNEWRPLKAENIVEDGTSGFQTTGIVKIAVPGDATNHNTICTDGLHWFCASVTKDSERIPQLIDVITQATEVIFEDNENDASHFDKALAAGTIGALQVAAPEVSKVSQPFASFDGKHREIGKEFYTRVSERLRHKHRAITPWDYEHLVLNRFPSIYKVKCITHTDPDCLCREPIPLLSEEDEGKGKKAAVKKYSIKFKPGESDNIGKSMMTLNAVLSLLRKNPGLIIKLTGHSADTKESAELNASRMDWIVRKITETGIEHTINSNITADGEKNKIDIIPVKKKPAADDAKEEDVCCGPQVAPGHVLLIPIADLKNRNAVNPLQPKTSRRTLLDIESYLKKLTSPFVHVHAKNPEYEQVLVFFRVKFKPKYEIGYYIKQLNEEIVRFLTPWAFDEKAEVKFGEKIYASSVINFIEEREYVDFITDFLMAVCKDECCPPVSPKKEPTATKEIPATFLLKKTAEGSIVGQLNDATGQPMPRIEVRVKGTEIGNLTDQAGKFSLDLKTNDPFRLIFSFISFEDVETDAELDKTIDIIFKERSLEEVIVTGYGRRKISKEQIEKLCGCTSVEYLFQDELDIPGDIVAKPSTARSILVSAPRHIIVPYEAPPYLTPCQQRKEKLAAAGSLTDIIKTLAENVSKSDPDKEPAEVIKENLPAGKTKVIKEKTAVKKQADKKPNK